MHQTAPKVIIISFSPIHRDARVLRQVNCLSEKFTVNVIGYGQLDSSVNSAVRMHSIPETTNFGLMRKIRTLILLPVGRIFPNFAYESWYWGRANHRNAFSLLLQVGGHIIHANDWETLPVAVKAAQRTGACIILDLHEYAPLQSEEYWHWRHFIRPMIDYFLRKYISYVSATITVNEAIADKYAADYGFRSGVVMNTPYFEETIRFKPTDSEHIQLVHHGNAMRDRHLELMIQTMAYTDSRYTLHFILVESDPEYISWLKALAQELTPGKVFFHKPVRPAEIVSHLSEFDIGFYLLPFSNFNNSVALPNKFFDFIAAGLAVCVGPSPEMARLAQQFGFGKVTPSFEPMETATILNQLSAADIDQMKLNALEARKVLNADLEMGKLITLYTELFERQDKE